METKGKEKGIDYRIHVFLAIKKKVIRKILLKWNEVQFPKARTELKRYITLDT